MNIIQYFKKQFYTPAFMKYLSIGIFITILSALGSTIAGIIWHANPTLLFLINLLVVNGILFILKYVLFLKFNFIDKKETQQFQSKWKPKKKTEKDTIKI